MRAALQRVFVPSFLSMCGGCGVVDWWFAVAVPFFRSAEREIEMREACTLGVRRKPSSLAPSFLFLSLNRFMGFFAHRTTDSMNALAAKSFHGLVKPLGYKINPCAT